MLHCGRIILAAGGHATVNANTALFESLQLRQPESSIAPARMLEVLKAVYEEDEE